MKNRTKLIEVALPLDAINAACAREKSIRHGHPSTLHLWWARRPLAAARAVIFSQMVDDPETYVDELRSDPKKVQRAKAALTARRKVWEEARALAEKAKGSGLAVPEPGPEPTIEGMLADIERQRLFRIIEQLVLWENTTNEAVLLTARDEIWQSWRRACADNADHPRAKELFDRNRLPAFHDPFAGGGALPLEAQRLGLESHASDLNPVAVLINKAMIEIPPQFAGHPPVNPESKNDKALISREWRGAEGLAEDVRYYGQWMRDEAEARIGHLYPQVEISDTLVAKRPDLSSYAGKRLTVIAWLWARTVKSPNPAFADVDVPLATSFVLSPKSGKEAFVRPAIQENGYSFEVIAGKPLAEDWASSGTSAGKRAAFKCVMSGTPLTYDYIRSEGQAGRMGARLLAVIAEGDRERVYLSPSAEMEEIVLTGAPLWKPETVMHGKCRVNVANYGLDVFGDLYTPRQLVALTTFSDLAPETRARVYADAVGAGLHGDVTASSANSSASAYADAVATYLGLAMSRFADRNNALCTWDSGPTSTKSSTGGSARTASIRGLFSRQAIPMTWDFAESNPFSDSGGSYTSAADWIVPAVRALCGKSSGSSVTADAAQQSISTDRIISTDPPYYDNIGYADLSDFFYVWLRRSLKPILPGLFSTVAVPKAEELVATPFRHGSKEKAERFFLNGMTRAMQRLAEQAHSAFPVTIYYAFKQAEHEGVEGTTNSGWDTFLEAVIEAGFAISGTWPMRTELRNRMIGSGTNALASSVVLVCRTRNSSAPTATRREFISVLKVELPRALAHLQRGNIAPVDLAQAAIGPGMAVYTRYTRVVGAEGATLSVREALALINRTLDEALAEQEGDFDSDTRWALTWFEQAGFEEGEYGMAEQLSKAKVTSVTGLAEAGIIESRRGRVRLYRPEELPADWDPKTDPRLTAWEMVHHLIRVLAKDGEAGAAVLLRKLGAKAEVSRELCYRLYTLCERKKRATEALAYNGLVQSWPEIVRLAREAPGALEPEQGELL